jgi:hypothetical protein
MPPKQKLQASAAAAPADENAGMGGSYMYDPATKTRTLIERTDTSGSFANKGPNAPKNSPAEDESQGDAQGEPGAG